jgi:transcriptional regulator
MYCPPHFRADPAEALNSLARAPRLGLLVCNGAGAPAISPVPLLLKDGALIGHLARANPQAAALAAAGRAVAIFPGPDAYASSRRPSAPPRPSTTARCRSGTTRS